MLLSFLVENGRIHPGRIEDIHQKVQDEFEHKYMKRAKMLL